jgi:hypothetical protein
MATRFNPATTMTTIAPSFHVGQSVIRRAFFEQCKKDNALHRPEPRFISVSMADIAATLDEIDRLREAPPELLAALEALTNQCQDSRRYIDLTADEGFEAYSKCADAIQAARAAISKARGE